MRKIMEEKGIDFRASVRRLFPALPRNFPYHKRYGCLLVCLQIFNSFATTIDSRHLSQDLA